MESRPLSNLTFGSFLVYPSTTPTGEATRFKRAVLDIKEDRWSSKAGMRWPDYAAKRLKEELSGSLLENYFADSVLVPLPRSSLLQKHALWPGRRICEALVAQGVSREFESLLERQIAVRKSAGSGNRPTPQEHYESLAVLYPIRADRIILVDDVITRGSTALGAAWRIFEAMPGTEIKVFAIARTLPAEEVNGIVDIQIGTIQLSGESLHRTP